MGRWITRNGAHVYIENSLYEALDETVNVEKIKAEMISQLSNLNDDEEKILNRYTGNLAYNLNFSLNNGLESKFKNEIAILDKALNKGIVPEDLVLYRKVDSKVWLNKKNVSDKDIFNLKGTIITEKGYLSTSFKDFDYKLRDVNIVFKVPKGYKGALYIKHLAKSQYKNQDEVLFRRGVCYNICDIKKENNGYTLIAEVRKND